MRALLIALILLAATMAFLAYGGIQCQNLQPNGCGCAVCCVQGFLHLPQESTFLV